MHDTVAPLQVGVNVVSTLGVGGALFAAGNLLGRTWRRIRTRRIAARTEPLSGAAFGTRRGRSRSGRYHSYPFVNGALRPLNDDDRNGNETPDPLEPCRPRLG